MSEIIANPIRYAKSPTFLWMWATYALTYSVANSLKTITEHYEERGGSERVASQYGSAGAVFVGTTAVNSGASLLKDRAYARLFGTGIHAVPLVSYGFWMVRDLSTVGSSFVLPEHVAKAMEETNPNLSRTQSTQIAQILTPMAAQLVAGPFHFLGLEYYNRPTGASLANRWTALQKSWMEVVGARMARILPGYGIGGIGNRFLRTQYRNYLRQRGTQSRQGTNIHTWTDYSTEALSALRRHIYW